MNQPDGTTGGPTEPLSAEWQPILRRFEEACRRGERPRPEAFLPDGPGDTLPLRQALDRVDREYRQAAGEPTCAEGAAPPGKEGPTLPTAGGTDRPAGAAPAGRFPRVPGYELLGELGRGGMGVVYKARHLALNRTVALKMMLSGAHAGPSERARFKAEAEAVARLEHPNIVHIYEVGEHEGLPYLALEFVEGGSLQQHLAGVPQLARPAASLVEVLARAMHYAHQQGVVHRDLKPENVLLAPVPFGSTATGTSAHGYGTPKITDFGLAKRLDREGTASPTGAILGTPGYLAPEQAASTRQPVGPAADVYALGAILYHLLTGRPPFQGDTPLETVLLVLTEEPVPPGRLRPNVPRDLETVCLKCLTKAPAARYPGAEALADDLARFVRGEPIRARPVGPAERLWRWCRRNKAVATLLASLGAVLLGGLVAVTFLWLRSERNRGLAEGHLAEARREREHAEESLRQARKAVEDSFTRVSENKLLGLPGMEGLRKELLTTALEYYKSFIAQQQSPDLALRDDVATAIFRVATITELIGEKGEAHRAYREALELYGRLVEEGQATPVVRRRRATCLSDYGLSLLETGQPDEAGRQFALSREALEQLVSETDDVDARAALAKVCLNTALWHCRQGRSQEALAFYQRAEALQEKIVADRPAHSEYRADLALTYMNEGNLRLEWGRPEEALPLYEKTLRIQRELVSRHPSALYYRRLLAASLHNIGLLYRLNSRLADALGCYQEALKYRERLAAGHPDVQDYQNDLAETANNVGELQLANRHMKEALGTLKQSEEIFERLVRDNPKNAKYRNGLAWAWNNVGVVLHQLERHPEALAVHQKALRVRQELADQEPATVDYQARLADSHSNLANTLRVLKRPDEAAAHYEKSCALYEKLLPQDASKTKYRTNLALAWANLGYLEEERERYDDALRAVRKGLALRQEVVRVAPHPPRHHADLAQSHFYVGRALAARGKFAEARQAYDQALAIQERVECESDLLDYRADLGRTYIQLGNLLRDDHKLMDAFQWYRKATKLWDKLAAERPDVAEFQDNRGVAHYDFGITLQDMRLALAALSAHQKGRDVREKLAQEHPTDVAYRRRLAESWNSVGIAQLSLRRRDEALRSFEGARDRFAKLVEEHADNPRCLSDLGRAWLNIGITFAEMGKYKEALPGLQVCIDRQRQAIAKVRPSPDAPEAACALEGDRAGRLTEPKECKYRRLLGKAYLRRAIVYQKMGRHADAEAAWREGGKYCRDADDAYKFAAALAACAPPAAKGKGPTAEEKARRERFAGLAVEALRLAVALGFRDATRLERDSDLEWLGGRDDFKEVLAGLRRKG